MSDPGGSPGRPGRGAPPPGRTGQRVSRQRSTVGGRTYCVFVLVFFHMCFMNGIAQLYENHNNGGEAPDPRGHQGAPDSPPQPPVGPQKAPLGPREPETVREVFLPRIDGVKVCDLCVLLIH